MGPVKMLAGPIMFQMSQCLFMQHQICTLVAFLPCFYFLEFQEVLLIFEECALRKMFLPAMAFHVVCKEPHKGAIQKG